MVWSVLLQFLTGSTQNRIQKLVPHSEQYAKQVKKEPKKNKGQNPQN